MRIKGQRKWRPKPTVRERILTEDLSDYIFDETGLEIPPEFVRAMKFCLPKWNNDPETKDLRENLGAEIARRKQEVTNG